MDAGSLEPEIVDVSLNEIFQRMQVNSRSRRHEPRAWSCASYPPPRASAASLLQYGDLLQNLVSNAVKYTSKGKVLIGARRTDDRIVIQ